jgi:hypothetical protein
MVAVQCPRCESKEAVKGYLIADNGVRFRLRDDDAFLSPRMIDVSVAATACPTCGVILLSCDPQQLEQATKE